MNMQFSLPQTTASVRSQKVNRSGMSVLEIFGCLMALVGGIWLGALYLGVDVRHVATAALTESTLMDKLPESWRPAELAQENAPTPAELAASLQSELVALRQDVTSLHTGQKSAALPATIEQIKESKSTPTPQSSDNAKQASLNYWQQLSDVVRSQITLQKDAESAANQGNAIQVAALKGRICRFSATAVRALPTANVDPAEVGLGKELATWYENGAILYDEAAQAFESPPALGQVARPAMLQWEQAKAQHQNEGRLLKVRIEAVRNALTGRFGDGFAPLAGL